MSPVDLFAPGSRGPALAALAIGLALAPHSAAAIVGGQPDAGPLSRSAIMVLSSRGGVCSGVVVAPDAVLTAAHCASGAPDYRVHYRGDDGQPVLLEPAGLAVHPGYDKGAVAGRRRSIDLALVRLAAPLPARFAPATLTAAIGGAGETVVFGGYGVAREGDARSTGTFRTVELPIIEPYGRSTILVWAKGPTAAGACQGDSGGPVATATGAIAAVSGWASGSGRSGCGGISQGVLLGPQRGWIDATLAGWGCAATWR
jgi:hypothetical protein